MIRVFSTFEKKNRTMYYSMSVFLFLALAWSATAFDEHRPSSDAEWITLSETESFQPAPSNDNPRLRHAQRHLVEYSSKFANGETYYDEYSQAWRMLGMFIDCNPEKDDRRRQLDEANVDDDGSENTCQRYLLWAAYADLNYQGGGIGEYQFQDPVSGEWDTSAYLGDYFGQLFKHEAYCIWGEEKYGFMKEFRETLPRECEGTGTYDGSRQIYMDTKPETGGRIGIGLYTDSSCTIEYTRNRVKLEDIVSSDSGNSIYDDLETFNAGLATFSVCQPCKAYSLHKSGDDEQDDDDPFSCHDDAGYNSVNQCMKFLTKTDMETASHKEVAMASQQGSISRSYAADVTQSFLGEWGGLIVSMLVFVAGLAAFYLSTRPSKLARPKKIAVSSEPLMNDEIS